MKILCQERYEKAVAYAKEIKNDTLQKCIDRLKQWEENPNCPCDMTRTICVGKADLEMKKLYNTVLEAQLAGLEYLRAGVVCRDCDNVAREIINKDYNGLFGHSLGHSVGLEIHEVPCLAPSFDKILVTNNVVTVEPGIYVAGRYGCRIEDLVVIKENGIENLTKSPKNLIEL